ncbi:MAG: hypothetical protein JWL77_6320 [Chthonomonadaceae bacterium]|nr:hypothetical protein [Chthonomonadaceae bacterium]
MNNLPYYPLSGSGASCSQDPGPGLGPPIPPGGFCWDDEEMGDLPLPGPGGGGGSGPGLYTGGQVIWPAGAIPPCNPIP